MTHALRKLALTAAIAALSIGATATLPIVALTAETSALSQARFDHMSVNAHDFEGMLAWYQEKLGFTLDIAWRVEALDGKRLAYLSKNGATIEIVAADADAPKAAPPADFSEHFGRTGWGHFCFVVADVDAALAELRERGVETFVAAQTYPLDGTPYERRVGFVMDPEGNVIEFAEPLRVR
ncbi:MAG: VOC family protein [Pseudomonadota bacterium]